MNPAGVIALTSCLSLCTGLVWAQQTNQLDSIVVTAKTNASVVEMPTAVSVITAEEIKETGASSVQDLLSRVAGFSWTSNSYSLAGRKNVSLRGMDSQHVLVLIDGKRINASDGFIGHSNFQISGIPLQNVKRVEVIKSAGTVLYGSNAMGGVINIITKDNTDLTHTNVSASIASLDSRSGGDTAGLTLNAGRALGAATFVDVALSETDRNSAYTGGSVVIEGQLVQDTSIELQHTFDSGMQLTLDYADGHEERRGSSMAEYDIDRSRQGLKLAGQIGDMDTVFQTYKQESDSAYYMSGAPYYVHRINDTVTRVDVSPSDWQGHVASFGIEYQNAGYKKDYVSPSKVDYTATGVSQTSVFFQDKLAMGKGDITIGGRYDDSQQFGSQLSPEVGLSLPAGEGMRARINFARGFKAPNIKEADGVYTYSHLSDSGTSDMQHTGNSDLKAETSDSITLGLQSTNKDGLSWSVDIYSIRAKDFISTVQTGNTAQVYNYYIRKNTSATVYQYQNLDKANIEGLELSLSNNLSDSLYFNANMTLMNTDDGAGNKLAYRPDVTLKMDLVKYLADDLNMVWSVNHTGDAEDGYGAKVEAYTVHDLVLNKWLDNDVQLQLAINNLAGELNDAGNALTELPGREYKFTLSRSF